MLTPYKHQREIIDRFRSKNTAGLFLDPGTGKTLIAINLLRYRYAEYGRVLRTLIFAPGITLNNWKQEFELCSNVDQGLIGVVMGSAKKRLQTIEDPRYSILIINPEALRTEKIHAALKDWRPEASVFDESHMIKSPKSKMFTACCQVTFCAEYRYVLTGTPMPNSAMDIWAQAYFLDRGQTFLNKFYPFKNRYFVDLNADWSSSKAFPNWQFNKTMEDDFKARLASFSIRLKKEDCIDLPELVEQTIPVEMSAEQSKHYKMLVKEMITWIEAQQDNPLVVQNALTKLLRLNELVSGYLKLEDDTIHKLKTNPRLDALMGLIESVHPHKVIVFTIFKETYRDIRHALEKKKIEYCEIHGGVSQKAKLEAVENFNDMSRPERVCIIHPKSGGVGINLKSARYAITYTRSHSLIDFEQAKARNYRAGSIDLHDKITHYHIVTPNTVDAEIVEALRNKKKLSESLLSIRNLLR